MNIYEFTPQQKNKKASGVILILFSLAAGLFLFTLIFPSIAYKWIIQLISIISFVAVIFIISRYVAKSFVYAIFKNDDEALDFTVTELTNAGRKQITVCRISVDSIEEAYIFNRSVSEQAEKCQSIQKSAKADGRKFFNYCPDINPTDFCIILVEECGEKFLLKISYDPSLWRYFNNK